MKKGLLSILAGALLVVGCQNYDDQFDGLETQINALASTVAGLSQVQSQLAELAGTVSSLSSTVTGLGSTIDTAVAEGLAGIQADIDKINTAVADVASSEDLAALQTAVDASQDDLEELLANSAVFQGNVIVNNTATLATFHTLKSSLAIVNGYVDIDAKADMDATKLQELVDAIQVTTKQFDYQAETSTVGAVTFNKLSGTQSLTVLQAGDYLFQSLGSATIINLKDDFKSKVTKIDFRELTSVSQFQTSGVSNTISFNKATELHLTKLAFYAPLDLTIVTDEGAAMPFIIDDADVDGDQSNIILDITGPASFTATNLEDGTLTFKDVATVDVDGFEGGFIIKSGVESFSADKVSALTIDEASDLETLDITGITDPDSTTDQSGPAITLTDTYNGDLETVTIAGNVGAIAIDGDKITTVTITADSAGSINVSNSDDLTTLTLTGSKATGVTVSGNDSLSDLTVDTTITKGRSDTAALTAALLVNGSVAVTTNESLESLTITSSNLKTLTITGNEVLSSLTATGITAVGVTAGASVNIYGNNFTATKSEDKENTASTLTATGGANDLGAFTTTSGMDTLATFLKLVVADTKATAAVYFDTVAAYIGEDGLEDGFDATYSNETTRDTTTASDEQRILVLEADNTVAAVSAIAETKAFFVNTDFVLNSNVSLQFTNDGTNSLLAGTTDPNSPSTISLTNADTAATLLAKINATVSVERAALFDITFAAKRGGGKASKDVEFYSLNAGTSSASIVGIAFYERWDTAAEKLAAVSSTAIGIDSNTLIKLAVGANNVTASPGIIGGTVTDTGAVVDALVLAWNAKYGPSGTASNSAIVSVIDNGNAVTITPLSDDSAAYEAAIVVTITDGSDTTHDSNSLDFKIGTSSDTGDNSLVDQGLILTFTSNKVGVALNTVASVASSTGTVTPGVVVPLTSTNIVNSVSAGDAYGYAAALEGRADAVNAEDGIGGTASTATRFTRVHWL